MILSGTSKFKLLLIGFLALSSPFVSPWYLINFSSISSPIVSVKTSSLSKRIIPTKSSYSSVKLSNTSFSVGIALMYSGVFVSPFNSPTFLITLNTPNPKYIQ